jgi:hypothetical protein
MASSQLSTGSQQVISSLEAILACNQQAGTLSSPCHVFAVILMSVKPGASAGLCHRHQLYSFDPSDAAVCMLLQ